MLFALPGSIYLSCLCKWEAWNLVFLSLLSWLTASPFISQRAAWSLTAGARPYPHKCLWVPLMWEGECESKFEIPHLVSPRRENKKPRFHFAQIKAPWSHTFNQWHFTSKSNSASHSSLSKPDVTISGCYHTWGCLASCILFCEPFLTHEHSCSI